MALYLFLIEYILWNVNNMFCMFISIIHLFHILSWLLDECGWENGLYNFYRTTVDWGMIGRASQWNILKRKESSGRRHITLFTIICVGGMWTTRKVVDDLLMLWNLTINNDYGRQGGGGNAILGHVHLENPKMALENMALNSLKWPLNLKTIKVKIINFPESPVYAYLFKLRNLLRFDLLVFGV